MKYKESVAVYLPVILLIIYGLAVYLPNILRFEYPLGCAGLYLIMSDRLFENNFVLPVNIPFYGPGGIPLAYPPVAFYITAFFTHVLNVPIMTYLKFFPLIWAIASLVIMYFLFAKILCHQWLACFSSILVSTSLTIYYYQLTAGGIVRGLAFLFSLLALFFTYSLLEGKRSFWIYLLASIFVGLTILTHFTYALFTIISIIALSVGNKYQRLLRGGIILTGGLIVASPWIIFMWANYGLEIFQSALNSHGTLSMVTAINQPIVLLDRLLMYPARVILDSPGIAFFALVGLVFELVKKRIRMTGWFFLTLIFVSEGYRFLIMINGLLAGCAFLPFLSFQSHARNKIPIKKILIGTAAIVWGLNTLYTYSTILLMRPVLKSEMFEIANWSRLHTKPNDTYMALMNEDSAEWFPYLLQRTPVVGYWGSEWNGRFSKENQLFFKASSCVTENSYPCLKQVMRENQISPQYLITPGDVKYEEFSQQMVSDPDVDLVFAGVDFMVWQLPGIE